MSDGEPKRVPAQNVFLLRIIHFALLTGCAVFAVIAVVSRNAQPVPPPDPPLLTYIGVALAVSTGMAYLVVPNLILAGWRRRVARAETTISSSGDRSYWEMYQTYFIIGAALLEGTIFLQLIAYLVEGQGISLGVAAFFWLALLAMFPTEDKMSAWLNQQRDLIEQIRQIS